MVDVGETAQEESWKSKINQSKGKLIVFYFMKFNLQLSKDVV